MERIYFDNAATTAVAPQVLEAMLPCFSTVYGNASSLHTFGLEAKRALAQARSSLAISLGVKEHEIVITSGGTEANNLALKGIAALHEHPQHLIVSAIEHPSVLKTARALQKAGWQMSSLRVEPDGRVAPDTLRAALRDNTALVSIMTVNNETGVVQPIAELSAIAAEHGIPFHTDAVQAMGKIPLNLDNQNIGLLTLAAHKFHGPKGVGLLVVRNRHKLISQVTGGGQEEKRRAGTENLPGIVGMAKAAELATAEGQKNRAHLKALSDHFLDFVESHLEGACLNGERAHLAPGIVNLSFPGMDSMALMMGLDLKGFAVSNGSACSSGSVSPSHVLQAMRIPKVRQLSALRISFGKWNTPEQVEALQVALLELTKGKMKVAKLAKQT
ncbi:MAG: cysteine desulfurase [Deferribacteres bacterium]|nr:cysteine desulfurase [Deferribacteres bacterium]